ncbi:AlbA family DNA-binding domain-containing protein [Corynebacterium glucuronolyticum]
MYTPIHRALGWEAGELTFDLIKHAIEQNVPETSDLDWKRKLYNCKGDESQEEVAKDIAAMANSGGGWIVFGVDEDNKKDGAIDIKPVTWSTTIQQQLLQIAYAKIGPPVLGIRFFDIPCDEIQEGGSVVMMCIPDSRDAPHFAHKGGGAFVAPRRNGPHTVFMTDREIERGFRERFQYADDQERLLQNKFDFASQAMRASDGVFLACAALPLEPTIHRESPSRATIQRLSREGQIPDYWLANPSDRIWTNSRQVIKGMRQWKIKTTASTGFLNQKFLNDDATVLAAFQLGKAPGVETDNNKYPGFESGNHCFAEDLEEAIIDFLAVLRSFAQERQANGGYRIRAGLVGAIGEDIYIRISENMEEKLSEPISLFQPVNIEIDILAEPMALLPQINDFALDLVNQAGIEKLRVIAESSELEIG